MVFQGLPSMRGLYNFFESVLRNPHTQVAEDTCTCYNMPTLVWEYDLIAEPVS